MGEIQQQQEPKEEPEEEEEEECNVAWSISAVDDDSEWKMAPKFSWPPLRADGRAAVGQPAAVTPAERRRNAMVATGQPVAATPMKVHIFNRFEALEEQDTTKVVAVGQPTAAAGVNVSKARKLEIPMPAPSYQRSKMQTMAFGKHTWARMPISRKKKVFTKFNACQCCPMDQI